MSVKLSWIALAAGVAVSLAIPGNSLLAQNPKPEKTVQTTAAKGRGAATAADENIKTPRAANSPTGTVPAPAAKGGPQTRGSSCVTHVDNRTRLYIDVYLDGDYRGTVGPWDDLWRYVGCGSTRMYARANYTDGTYSYWGPTVNDVDGTFHWHLNP